MQVGDNVRIKKSSKRIYKVIAVFPNGNAMLSNNMILNQEDIVESQQKLKLISRGDK